MCICVCCTMFSFLCWPQFNCRIRCEQKVLINNSSKFLPPMSFWCTCCQRYHRILHRKFQSSHYPSLLYRWVSILTTNIFYKFAPPLQVLSNHPIFKKLKRSSIAKLLEKMEMRLYTTGQFLCKQKDVADRYS